MPRHLRARQEMTCPSGRRIHPRWRRPRELEVQGVHRRSRGATSAAPPWPSGQVISWRALIIGALISLWATPGCDIRLPAFGDIHSADQEPLCTNTYGTWSTDDLSCDCGPGGGWHPLQGCFAEERDACEGSGGAWLAGDDCGPYCGSCACPGDMVLTVYGTCAAAGEPLAECLRACGGPAQCAHHEVVCGADGEWYCPCDFDCYGVAKADDIERCCPPVGTCAESCDGNTAITCGYVWEESTGCPSAAGMKEPCGTAGCAVNGNGQAYCVGLIDGQTNR